jgi:hypothetical protein
MEVPEPPTTLYTLDAERAKQLYSSEKTMSNFTHFSAHSISEGRVHVVTHDSTICAFGLPE